MTELVVTEEARPGVLVLRLNRPDQLNTMNAESIEALHEALRPLRHDAGVRAIVLTGAGRAFCAGLDLQGYGTPPHTPEGEGRSQVGMRAQEHISDLGPAFRATRAPIIAAVNGPAVGGGLGLALFADLRIVGESAVLQAAFIKRGLSGCDIGVSWLLPRMVGFAKAAELMLTGRKIGAQEAVALGLASAVHPDDQLLDAALDLGEEIAANSPFGVWMTKEVMWSNLETPSFRAGLDLENRTQILAALTKDHREAVSSFLEKRPPVYGNN